MKKLNNQGSALIWTLLVSLILIVFITGLGVMVSSRNSQNMHNLTKEQAYLTARSGAELIANEICSGSSQTTDITDYLLANNQFEITNADFPNAMGNCDILVTLENTSTSSYYDPFGQLVTTTTATKIKVLSTATYHNVTQKVSIHVVYTGSAWQISYYDNK